MLIFCTNLNKHYLSNVFKKQYLFICLSQCQYNDKKVFLLSI